jgi:hypothetical protein
VQRLQTVEGHISLVFWLHKAEFRLVTLIRRGNM